VDLTQALGHATAQGLASALPLSASGHRLIATIWLGGEVPAASLEPMGQIGSLLAIVLVVRQRLARAFGQGLRGIARPSVLQQSEGGRDALALFLSALTALGLMLVVTPMVTALRYVPIAAGVTMLLTAAALLSTLLAPPPTRSCPTALGAILVGLGSGISVAPGASQLAASFVLLCWLGVERWRAAEFALLVTAPILCFDIAVWLARDAGSLPSGDAALTIAVSFLSASLAARCWRSLCDQQRTVWLNLWLVPVALALITYGRSLPN